MKNLITKHKLNPIMTIIGAVLFYLIFSFVVTSSKILNTNFHIPLVIAKPGIIKSTVVLFLTIITLIIGFGANGFAQLLGRPQKPISNFIIWFILSFIIALSSGIILTQVLKIPLAANPAHNNPMEAIKVLPMQLFFEEGISFFILIVSANLIFKATKSWKIARILGSVIGAIAFGALHYSTYYYISPLDTILHIMLVQGVARIGFNEGGLRSNSMWIPYLIHLSYDVFILFH